MSDVPATVSRVYLHDLYGGAMGWRLNEKHDSPQLDIRSGTPMWRGDKVGRFICVPGAYYSGVLGHGEPAITGDILALVLDDWTVIKMETGWWELLHPATLLPETRTPASKN